jgi:hypothetical protein
MTGQSEGNRAISKATAARAAMREPEIKPMETK